MAMIDGKNQKLLRNWSQALDMERNSSLNTFLAEVEARSSLPIDVLIQEMAQLPAPGWTTGMGSAQTFRALPRGIFSNTAKHHQHKDDDQYGANHADPAMTEAVAIAAKSSAESAQQEDDKNDNQDCTE